MIGLWQKIVELEKNCENMILLIIVKPRFSWRELLSCKILGQLSWKQELLRWQNSSPNRNNWIIVLVEGDYYEDRISGQPN